MKKEHSITYLDYAATTPVDRRVIDAMLPYFAEYYGNPSSIHSIGQQSEAALEDSRQRIADILHCDPAEVIFTSCGSESDNLAIRGAALAAQKSRQANHILITPVEHHAISVTAAQLSREFGFEIEYLPVDSHGRVQLNDVESLIRPHTAIVSAIYANNEIGTINPISEIGNICKQKGIYFHTDAVQAGAYLSLNTKSLNVDLMSLGAHKLYGPKGIGVLYVKRGTQMLPVQTGGGQEFGFRAGTPNIPYIVGFAKALELSRNESEQRYTQAINYRDRIIQACLDNLPNIRLTGHPTERLPNHSSFVFEGIDGNALIMQLDMLGFACSSGSACKTGNPEPSDVLLNIGIPPSWALGSLRVTTGIFTSNSDIDTFLEILPNCVQQIRQVEHI